MIKIKKKSTVRPMQKALVAKPHPPMYMIHKYWARKPHNIVAEYIRNFTKKGDVVCDPFCGSGVTPAEAIKLDRKAIGTDLNPMAMLISTVTCKPMSTDKLTFAFGNIRDKVRSKINDYYQTVCPKCNELGETLETAWTKIIRCPYCYKDVQLLVAKQKKKYKCTKCKRPFDYLAKKVIREDPIRIKFTCNSKKCEYQKSNANLISVSDSALREIRKTEKAKIPYWYPKGKPLHESAKRSVDYFHEFFTRGR